MRRPFVFTLHFFLVVGLASTAFGLGYDVPKGATVGRGVEWPNGFHEILDQPNRVHGYVFNQYESYFYQGSAAELNKTLKRLAATSGLELKVLVGVGPGEARSPWSKKPVAPANWAIDFENNHKVKSLKTTLTIWTGGGLRFDDLNIPATIKLKRYDVPKGAAVKRAVEWPKGLYEILEQPNRVHGYVLDQGEEYFYQGSTAQLNKVLKQLSAIGGLELEVLIGVGVGVG